MPELLALGLLCGAGATLLPWLLALLVVPQHRADARLSAAGRRPACPAQIPSSSIART